jgi:hypothetical protein
MYITFGDVMMYKMQYFQAWYVTSLSHFHGALGADYVCQGHDRTTILNVFFRISVFVWHQLIAGGSWR